MSIFDYEKPTVVCGQLHIELLHIAGKLLQQPRTETNMINNIISSHFASQCWADLNALPEKTDR